MTLFFWPEIAVADLMDGPILFLFLDQSEARRDEKNFLGDRPPSYLKVWIHN